VRFLRRRDGERGRLAFVDVAADDYDASSHGSISYRDAMERIHGLTGTGEVVRDVEVFRRAYALVGLGWLYAPSRWPLLRGIADGLYRLWARWRLRLTGRPPLDQLCCEREGRCSI
jgi:predicted DCC family thiol-disulfide oxidoreductase YuxK